MYRGDQPLIGKNATLESACSGVFPMRVPRSLSELG